MKIAKLTATAGGVWRATAALREPIPAKLADKKLKAAIARARKALHWWQANHNAATPEDSAKLDISTHTLDKLDDRLTWLERGSLSAPLTELHPLLERMAEDVAYAVEPVLSVADIASLQDEQTALRMLEQMAKHPENWHDREMLAVIEWSNKLRELVSAVDAVEAARQRAQNLNPAAAAPGAFPVGTEPVEKLYHTSLFANDILHHGFKAEVPIDRAGVGNFGKQHTISFTFSRKYATELFRFFVVAWQVAHGELTLARAAALFKAGGYESRYDLDAKRDRKGTSWEQEDKANKKQRADHALREFRQFCRMHDRDVNYLAVVDLERFYRSLLSVDLSNIGVLECEVSTEGAEYLPGEMEFRVLPAAVRKVNRIVTTQSKGRKATAAAQPMQAVAAKALNKAMIPKAIKDNYPLIGQGMTSMVFALSDDEVLMVSCDPIKRDWLYHLGYDLSHKHHEALRGIEVRRINGATLNQEYELYAIKMPRFYPLPRGLRKKVAEALSAATSSIHSKSSRAPKHLRGLAVQDAMQDEVERLEAKPNPTKEDELLIDLFQFLSNYDMEHIYLDMHGANVMQTKDGDLVLVDPLITADLVDTNARGYIAKHL